MKIQMENAMNPMQLAVVRNLVEKDCIAIDKSLIFGLLATLDAAERDRDAWMAECQRRAA